MLKHELHPQRIPKMRVAAAVVGILAVIAISSPVNAQETFTLAELAAGEEFTIGGVLFSSWTVDSDTTVPAIAITIDTIDDPNLPGFRVNGNGELIGDETELIYTFTVTAINAVMSGGLLSLTGFEAPEDEGEISIDLRDDSVGTGLELEVFVNDGTQGTKLIDAAALSDSVTSLEFEARLKLDIREAGILRVDTYETRIIKLLGSDIAYVSQTPGCDGNTPCYTTVQAAVDGEDSDKRIR